MKFTKSSKCIYLGEEQVKLPSNQKFLRIHTHFVVIALTNLRPLMIFAFVYVLSRAKLFMQSVPAKLAK